MSALDEPLVLQQLPDASTPEELTQRRRDVNILLAAAGVPAQPASQYELDWYSRVGRTPPTD